MWTDKNCLVSFLHSLLTKETIFQVKVYMIPFCNKLKINEISLKVKIFLNLLGTYKKVCQVGLFATTILFSTKST